MRRTPWWQSLEGEVQVGVEEGHDQRQKLWWGEPGTAAVRERELETAPCY